MKTWIFRVTVKNIYTGARKFKKIEYDSTLYTWHKAWLKCVNNAISNLYENEVVCSIESENDIVRYTE